MIVCAAMKWTPTMGYPVIFCGESNPDCLAYAIDYGFGKTTWSTPAKVEYGFMTDKNQFLDRYDAKIEARKCGQLVLDTDDRALYTEDIWPERISRSDEEVP